MYDKLLAAGSTFDWLSPLIAFILDAHNGPAEHMRLPDDTEWSGKAIERLLKSRGIRCWGFMMVGDQLLFSVSQRQAEYTRYWLTRAGVLGGGQWAPGPNAGWGKKPLPEPVKARKRESLGNWLFKW